jgi:hypothetical protein
MRIAAFSPLSDFVSRSTDLSSPAPVRESTTITSTPSDRLRVEYSSILHHTMIRASTIVILTLLDLTCILWVYPLANQLAEWAGVSYTHAIYVGLGSMLASVPLVIMATILLWRRMTRSQE